jgi:hypothetical protein
MSFMSELPMPCTGGKITLTFWLGAISLMSKVKRVHGWAEVKQVALRL